MLRSKIRHHHHHHFIYDSSGVVLQTMEVLVVLAAFFLMRKRRRSSGKKEEFLNLLLRSKIRHHQSSRHYHLPTTIITIMTQFGSSVTVKGSVAHCSSNIRGKKEEFGKKRRVCQSLLSLAIDLFAQHEIVVARAKARDSRFVPCNCEAKCRTIC